jgi:hypothetical protein
MAGITQDGLVGERRRSFRENRRVRLLAVGLVCVLVAAIAIAWSQTGTSERVASLHDLGTASFSTAVSGSADVRWTAGALLYNSSDQPVTVVSADPMSADGLEILRVDLAPFGTGFPAGSGIAGYPPPMPSSSSDQVDPVGDAQVAPVGRMMMPGESTPVQARWLVVTYRLAGSASVGTARDFRLTYRSGDSGPTNAIVVHMSVKLCADTPNCTA